MPLELPHVAASKIKNNLESKVFISHLLFCFAHLFAGSSDKSPLGKQRIFLGYSHCRESIGLSSGKSYLIMGTLDNTEKIDDEYVSCFYLF